VTSDLFGCFVYIDQVGMAVAAAGRGADGNKDEVGLAYRGIVAGGELQPSSGDVALDEIIQARLVDGHYAFFQLGDFFLADIDAGDVGAEFREAGAGDEADIAGADHDYVHGVISWFRLLKA
jgi:hypothetical protein